MKEVFIIGGGAAGYFSAINIAEARGDINVTILEKTSSVLSKVKISGGGRCNVTHACFEPKELVKFYPRGGKELLGPFHQFQPGDVISWFSDKGVELKVEEDGRMFPISDSSQTILDCFMNSAEAAGVQLKTNEGLISIVKEGQGWNLTTVNGSYQADAVVFCAGSSKKAWKMLREVNHALILPLPSLFTFNIQDNGLHELAGLSFKNAHVEIPELKHFSDGPLLITHWGLSGPAVLKASSYKARELAELDYKFEINVNFVPEFNQESVKLELETAQVRGKKRLSNHSPFKMPMRFWNFVLKRAEVPEERIWPELRKEEKRSLIVALTQMTFEVNGKSTFKEEFVTAGGVDLKQINFKTMESKLEENLFFSGEVLNIDAVTGGFNFQAAWTTAYIAAQTIIKKD